MQNKLFYFSRFRCLSSYYTQCVPLSMAELEFSLDKNTLSIRIQKNCKQTKME